MNIYYQIFDAAGPNSMPGSTPISNQEAIDVDNWIVGVDFDLPFPPGVNLVAGNYYALVLSSDGMSHYINWNYDNSGSDTYPDGQSWKDRRRLGYY